MKRIIRILGMMVAATLTLTNCNKVSSIEEPAAKLFTIRANTGADSKTTNDGMHTLWAENDEVSLLYAPAGTDVTSEFTNVQMTIASGAGTSSAEFTGEASLSGSNDFYAIYPYASQLKIPGQRNSGYIYVGNSNKNVKNGVTQDGYNSMAHLSGSNCPMYGVVLDNDDETIPEFTMKQLASVIELSIRSYSNEDFILKKVELLASEDIVGSYYIDITGTNPVYTPSDANYVSNTAVVNIENGAAVSKGSTIKVYIPIKPYVQAEGTVLHFVYTATVGGVTMTTTDDIGASTDVAKRTFHAGKIKRVSSAVFGFTAASTYTLSDLVSAVTGTEHDFTTTESYTVENARVMAKNNSNVILEDDTDIMLYYGSNSGINVGDVVTVSGNVKNHYYTAEIVSGSLTKTDTFTPDYSTPSSFDAAAFKAAYNAHQVVDVNLVTFTGTVDAEGKYVSIDGTTLKSSVYGISATLKGKDVTVVGYPVGVGSATNGNPINFVPVSVEERGGVTPPPATGSQISDLISVAASLAKDATSTESYTVENAKVMAINGGNAVVQDATGIILYYGTLTDIEVGDVVTMMGKVKNYFYTPEVTNGSLTKTSTFTPDYSGASTSFNPDSFKSTYTADQQLTITLASVTGILSADAKTLTVAGKTTALSPYGVAATFANKEVEMVGYAIGVSKSGSINFIPVSVTDTGSVTPPAPQNTVTWDLSVDETSEATDDRIAWTSAYATMVNARIAGGTSCVNYYPGTPEKDYTSTRFYKNSTLTISPVSGYAIDYVEFIANTTSYANYLVNSTWTNAESVVANGTTVTVTPSKGTSNIVAVISGTCGFTSVSVHYDTAGSTPDPDPDPQPDPYSTASITFSAAGYANADAVETVNVNSDITLTFDKGTNSNGPKYYTTGAAVRMYGSNTMTVSASSHTIKEITITFGSGDGSNEITATPGTFESPKWTGTASSVTFTVGGDSGNRRISAVTVKYE